MDKLISLIARYFREGIVPWIFISLFVLFWGVVSAPLEMITHNFFLKFLLLLCMVVIVGILKEILGTLKRHVLSRTFIKEMFPDALKGRQVVQWPIAPGVYAVGVLLREDETRGVSIVMDVMGGPTSLTWTQREVVSSALVRVNEKTPLDLFSELISLGVNN